MRDLQLKGKLSALNWPGGRRTIASAVLVRRAVVKVLCRKARLEIPGFVEKLLPQVVELVRFSKLLPQGEEHAIRRGSRDFLASSRELGERSMGTAHQIFSFLAQSLHQGTKPEDGLITALESACSGWWLTSRQAFLQLLQRILSACHVHSKVLELPVALPHIAMMCAVSSKGSKAVAAMRRGLRFFFSRPGPLAGVRVLDMTRVLAGPSCTQVLGDLGAEVTKVERPQVGDDTRGFAPPFLPGAAQETQAMAAYFAAQNRNKASLTVNYTLPEGQDILKRLLKTSDVLVENFKTGTLEKYGLGYDDLRHSYPSLVYCSITGFGQTGPYSPRPGYDALVQAMGGFMSVTGEVEGEPMKVGVPIHDLFAGLHGVIGILAALRHAAMTGEGQHVDIGMLDVSTAMLANQASNFLSTGKLPERLGNQHPNIVPYQVMPASDGYFILAVGNDPTFQRFLAVADKADPAAKAPALLDDCRFNSQPARVDNRKLVTDTCNAITRTKPVEWWLRELESASIGCSPIKNLQEVFEDPQVKAREMVIEMPIEGHAPAKLVASPLKFSSTPCSTKEIAQLREKGVDLKNFNLMVDSIDDVLEKVDTNLRDAKSGKQAEEAPGDEEEPAPTPSAGSHAVRAAKPQVRWRQLVDNHRKRFVPRLVVKHNEKTPLSPTLLEAQCKAGIRSSSGAPAPQTLGNQDGEAACQHAKASVASLEKMLLYRRAILAQTPARSSGLPNTMRVVLAYLLAAAAAASLVQDLAEQLGAERASAVERRALPLEAVLRPILQALPKSGSGNCLGAAAARYALHRVFVQERGWFVKGLQELDPSRVVANASTVAASPVAILQDQVPEAVKSLFEEPLRQQGLCLRELAMLAALLEDLVHRETMQRVGSAFNSHHVPLVGRVTVERVTAMLEYVMMSYILEVASLDGTNLVADDAKAYLEGRLPMEDVYPSWPKTQKFIRDIQEVVAPSQKGSLSFEDVTHIVEEINEHYGRWHDESDCADMKSVLLNMEGKCPGRVDLSRFYSASLYEDRWQFSESVHYLRDLGALDESQPESSVIVSNYVLGASNCVGTSRFYAQCCVDPCDQLMAQLEKALAAPRAAPSDLRAALAALPAPDSTVRPVEELQKASEDGLVALHGRLFAQWLHHAYPRQCPMPSRAGMRLWQELPRDFTLRTGQDYAATHEEMKRYADQKLSKEGVCRLPWISEELLVSEMPATASVGPPDVAHSLKAVLDSGVAKTLCLVGFALLAAVVVGVAKRTLRTPAARGPLLATESAQPASCEELSTLSWPDDFFRPHAACRFNRMEDTPLIMVRTEQELKEMVEEIKATCIGNEIAVDVEHHDFRSFRGFVCLIQVSTRKKDFLIDPFDIFEQLHMLNEVFSDPRIVKVLHGADRDVLWLQRDFSIYLVNMFDTGLATRALRLQGGYSLANLVSHFCGVRFSLRAQGRDEGGTWLQGKDMDDWSTDSVAVPVQTELHATDSGGGLGHVVGLPPSETALLGAKAKGPGPGPAEDAAEVQRLREENARLRAQVRELQVVLATGVLTEIARLREENEELQLKSAVMAESWVGKGWKGPAALLQAPYDLFLVFSIKAAEITAYYGFSYIFVSYVSDEYGMSDEEAGRLYGAYGFACTGVGLLLGFLIDRLGVRRSMLLGCTCSTLYRAVCALASSRQLMWFSTMTFAPVGAAFGVPVLALAVRRYTHRENRAFAFSFFYSMLCLGCLLGSVLINIVRDVLVDGTVVLGVKLSWMRMVLWLCTACTFYTVIASLFVRDIQILSDMPLKDREYCKFKPANFQVRQTIKEIMGQAKFWRLAGITGIFIGRERSLSKALSIPCCPCLPPSPCPPHHATIYNNLFYKPND
eukprot:s7589_g1.t2